LEELAIEGGFEAEAGWGELLVIVAATGGRAGEGPGLRIIWNFRGTWGEYVTTEAAGRPTY
jgi:hypothetical protein